jgi:threonine/homoserine/homoserine lactone efflux protein
MLRLIRLFAIGMLISFAGALPLGTLNVSSMQIAVAQGSAAALQFALGALAVEVLYVRVSLTAMDWFRRNERVFKVFEWVTLALVSLLAVTTFLAATPKENTPPPMLGTSLPPALLGVLMSSVNPLQVPFWFGWSAVLTNSGALKSDRPHRRAYLLGIGTGSLLGFCVFIFGGQWLVQRLEVGKGQMQYFIAAAFALTAVIQAWKMWRDANRRGRKGEKPG